MVNDLNETQNKKPKSTLLISKSLDNFIDTSTILINQFTDVTSPPPFYTERPNKIPFPKFNLFPNRHHTSHQKTAPLPFSPVQHPPLPNYTHDITTPNRELRVFQELRKIGFCDYQNVFSRNEEKVNFKVPPI